MTRKYSSSLREEQAALTRERILDAAHALLRHTRPVDLSYKDVAAEAGVSKRTVYRVFPTPDDLFAGLADRLLVQTGGSAGGYQTVEDAMTSVHGLWKMMEADPALFRVIFAVPSRSRHGGRPLMDRLLGERFAHLSDTDRDLAYALVDLLASPYAWDVLHANWGADADQAIRAVSVALRVLLERFDAEQHPFEDAEIR